ncbi:flagellar hook-basal body complex protein [Tabrizicola sp.]|jgi:flagellar basal-body rod protein FlgF|uniref:flagellar hook-basal body complex protein n=1 Tax=Tabrizicola sp. TaxID=2005166 RepID=UPI000BC70779|nr:flagellar hook-basal body complex protein [Tabrizicola sp.]MBY0350749.1 flagellar hook-basal body complex protein [Tabrizicola sp.]MDK2773858.1 flagellar hook-basal body complex protein [Tabrizicola sp.]OYX22054.1 MAG: flagellar basal-body rod protein FlgF [Rhodobacterales bacterium 32-66-9]
MEAASYTTLNRQSGLMREMGVVANNIANSSTTGFRREGVVFSEFVVALDQDPSLSMANASGRNVDLSQSTLSQTGGQFDFAIQGEGFFLIETPQGQRLTRAGSFTPSAEGELVTPDGYRLLDAGGAPIFVPPDARGLALAADGTLSAGGQPVARVGLWQPTDPLALRYQTGTLFEGGELEPVEGATILQGMLEDSNVEPVSEIARMIEVQRAYELGQKFLDAEDQRVRGVISTLGR